ncbi:MAG TPA: hypothetical protein VH416_09315 [Gaiellaceae bacterium]
MKLRLLLAACVALGLTAVGSAALAAGPANTTCSSGAIAGGTYNNVTVTGSCTFADGAAITINGSLTVANGAVLNDHALSTATVHVRGNVTVGKGGVVGLGSYPEPPTPGHDSAFVDGSVIGNGAASLYLGGMTVRGNVIMNGGGDPGRNLPIKDDTIGGNLIIQNWKGLWFGVIRDVVGGNVILTNNVAADPSTLPGSDSTEVVTNTIRGNLICTGNVPIAQVGDSEGAINTVSGRKLGECASL